MGTQTRAKGEDGWSSRPGRSNSARTKAQKSLLGVESPWAKAHPFETSLRFPGGLTRVLGPGEVLEAVEVVKVVKIGDDFIRGGRGARPDLVAGTAPAGQKHGR